jgi:WD40 repeat protein
MEALNYESFSNHIGDYAMTIDPDKNEIISGGEDFLMKVFDIGSKTSKSMKDVDDEIKAIKLCNGKLIFGQGNSLQMLDNFDSDNYNPKNAMLLTNFNSNVRKIEYNAILNCIITCSEDDDLHIIKLNTLDVFKYKTNHEGSLKNIKVNKNGTMLITSGCDGFITIYEFLEDGKIQIKKKLKISNKTNIEGNQQLGTDINEAGNIIISGNTYLKELNYNNIDSDDLITSNIPSILHKVDISICKWLNDSHIITCDIENTIKVWEFSSRTCIYTNEFSNQIFDIELLVKENKITVLVSFKNGDLNISQSIDFSPNKQSISNGRLSNGTSNKELENIIKETEDDTENILKKFEVNYKKEEEEIKHKTEENELLNLSDIEDGEGHLMNPSEIAQSNIIKLIISDRR